MGGAAGRGKAGRGSPRLGLAVFGTDPEGGFGGFGVGDGALAQQVGGDLFAEQPVVVDGVAFGQEIAGDVAFGFDIGVAGVAAGFLEGVPGLVQFGLEGAVGAGGFDDGFVILDDDAGGGGAADVVPGGGLPPAGGVVTAVFAFFGGGGVGSFGQAAGAGGFDDGGEFGDGIVVFVRCQVIRSAGRIWPSRVIMAKTPRWGLATRPIS